MRKREEIENAVMTLKDLEQWSRLEPSLGVVGFPINHSVSPQMHNAAFKEVGLNNWEYFRFELEPKFLSQAITLFEKFNFVGVNFTVPHKTEVYSHVAEKDVSALCAQAMNTLVFAKHSENGKTTGYSTDGFGLLEGLKEDLNFIPEGKTVLLLGAGGAGQTAAVTLEKAGAEVLWFNRTPGKVTSAIPRLGLENTYYVNLEMLEKRKVDLMINATSAGLNAGEIPIDFTQLDALELNAEAAYDMIYHPAESSFLASAKQRGWKTANGLSMLLWQGARAFEIWTSQPAPVSVMKRTLHQAIYGKSI